jgi:HD-GYP domain-containing protein (c-di-GMP phosphodiesterase class II)
MPLNTLRPEAGARFHQFVLGAMPVAAYLLGWEAPIWVAAGLSMAAIVSMRLAVAAQIWTFFWPQADDAPPIYFNHEVHRMDELVRTILLGTGLALLRTGHAMGWLAILSAASIAILAATTGFSFVTVFYAVPRALAQRFFGPHQPVVAAGFNGNARCMVCRALAAAPYHRCMWCNLSSVRSCCGLQTSMLLALMLVISFLLTSTLSPLVTKLLVTMSILGVVALGLAITRQTDDLVKTLSGLDEEHRRAERRCELLRRLALADSVQAVADESVAYVEANIQARRISIMLADEDGDVLRIAAARGLSAEAIQQTEVPIGQRICGRVFASGRPVVLRNVLSERPHEALGIEAAGAVASYPLVAAQMSAAGRKIGVINVTDRPGGEFGQTDLLELEFVAEATAISLASQLGRCDLERANLGALVTLAMAVEAKDPYTHGHSLRVELWSTAIGREMGLTGQRLQTLSRAAELHDIGKLAVPDSILQATRRLTQDEWNIIRDHPRRGAEMVKHLGFLREAQPAILYHHERVDGKGYPSGITGQEMPLEAKILGVADAYDAMTSARAYRPAMTHEAAVEELHRGCNAQFDPEVVEAFLRVSRRETGEVAVAASAASALG